MSLDPRGLAAGLILAAAAAARRIMAGELTEDEYTQALQQLPAEPAPELTFTVLNIGVGAGKVLEANSSPRRRVVMQNQSTSGQLIRVASKDADLPAGGVELTVRGVLIDEPPNPHGGEWYAVSSAAGGVLVVAEQR